MSELLPTVEAETIRESLLDYLTTTFALADEDARAALEEFLADPDDGIFKGPYVRLRLPFRPADPGWRESLEWYAGPTPYGHQAAAFARLSSFGLGPGERPKSTIVTTGTGSGKTEAFLYPILDHVRRAKRDGVTGIKALILYPMNALANDQAGRLAALITDNPELEGITAALYTGQRMAERTRVTADSLITNRREIRDNPPDILLTNYKMLDQLLLRADDASLWERSAHSLQYLVLDEFHTYDGAQGTDVSMLLRRLGLALKHYWTEDDPTLTPADWQRPLGRITPVATSATLGDKGDPAAMLDFARTVFGEDIGADAIVTESRLTYEEWAADAADRLRARGIHLPSRAGSTADADLVERVDAAVRALGDEAVGARLAVVVLTELWRADEAPPTIPPDDTELLLDLLKAHPLTAAVTAAAIAATSVRDLARAVVVDRPLPATEAAAWHARTERFVVALIAAVSHVRAHIGRSALTVDLHLWVRELTRIDRTASLAPRYLWSDDGEIVDDTDGEAHPLPALYCRHCGRSGWGVVLAPTGDDLDMDETRIRARRMQGDDRFRALVHAPTEGRIAVDGDSDEPTPNLRWFHVQERRLLSRLPSDEAELRTGRILPVLVHVGDDAGKLSKNDTCPSCLQEEGIRFLGSAIATLLSVTLSTLFGDRHLADREKKALVFTDSVQDAAHRAGFVQSRSHTLTLRALIRSAVGDAPVSLDEIVERMLLQAGDDPHRRYRLLPPDLADRDSFAPFWQAESARKISRQVVRRVRSRLRLDVQLEFGLQAGIGRTLERTGSVAGEVDIDEVLLLRCAQRALGETGGMLTEPSEKELLAWGRGVLTRMRQQGAIDHEWFAKYQQEDGNRWSIWGGRRRSEGMPAFPRGRPAPGYPRAGSTLGRDTDLEPVASARGWYAHWTARALGVPTAEGATLARLLFQQLAANGVLITATSKSSAQIYALPASAVVVYPSTLDDLAAGRHMLKCSHCETLTAGTVTVVRQLDDAPCLVNRCAGRLQPAPRGDNFYRQLYASTDPRRVVAREHTGLLDDEIRLAYENEFKAEDPDPGAPNVLVATPTLEMGIDIGDLSTVMLSSLPRQVSSYLQRVGRAGRLTGNALVLAYVTGRGDQLPRLGDPLSVIDGEVRPPATYLEAEEILRRQLVAALADTLARDPSAPHPARAAQAIATVNPGSYLHAIIEAGENNGELTEAFLAGFPSLSDGARRRLREWVVAPSGFGTSPLAQRLTEASQRWNHTVETLQHRLTEIQQSLPELEQRAGTPAASDDDKAAFRAARAAYALAGKQIADLRGDYWIGELEEHGLLPNYTLLDDSVTLDVSISWIDPDTGDFENDTRDYSRASAQALRDFAPGATFYAGGFAITIDAVDLGHEAEAIRNHAFCAACGYAHDTSGAAAPGACPRCGDTRLADLKQRIDVVELDKVSSAISRERATIDDSSEDRVRTRYSLVTAADVDPDKVVRKWFVEGFGFGAKYLRDMTVRWVNLGEANRPGGGREVAGANRQAPLFRVCEACGHQDTDTRANRPTEHRPWCRHRKATEEATRSIALSRTLRTEGIVLRLPRSVTLGDRFAVPSLATALLLGLRERIGGHPDHLAVATIVDPTPIGTEPNHEALLLHDVVPGGTGYLAELSDPAQVWQILHTAWSKVRDCPCRDEERLACHQCLLPFAQPFETEWVSRGAAERHLHDVLTGGIGDDVSDEMAWVCTDEEPDGFDPESHLEQLFRQVLRERLETAGASVKERPTPDGNRWAIRYSGRRWTLDPQVDLLGSRPDFVLRSEEPGIPEIVIFTDGWRYHASPTGNRLADDADKRETLRLSGRIVLGVTWQDLQRPADEVAEPPWYRADSRGMVMEFAGGVLKPGLVDLVEKGPVDFLLQWMQSPDPDGVRGLAEWLPMFAVGPDTAAYQLSTDGSLAAAAAGLLDGVEPPAAGSPLDGAWVHRTRSLVLAARIAQPNPMTIEVVALLDDRTIGHDDRAAWREWLRVSNLLALRQAPTTISVRSLVSEAPVPEPVEKPSAVESAAAHWPELYEIATDEEKAVVDVVWQARADQPEVGYETESGIPLAASWPERLVAVDALLQEHEREELLTAGWTLVAAEPDAIRQMLSSLQESG